MNIFLLQLLHLLNMIKQEAYKNSKTGVQKAAHQRILDDKGTKQIRKRNIKTGEQEEHNIFKGIKGEELDQFNESYNDFNDAKILCEYNSTNDKSLNNINIYLQY